MKRVFNDSFLNEVAPIGVGCSLTRKNNGSNSATLCLHGFDGLTPVRISLTGANDKELVESLCEEIERINRNRFILKYRDKNTSIEQAIDGFVEIFGFLISVAVRLCHDMKLDFGSIYYPRSQLVIHRCGDCKRQITIPLNARNYYSVWFSDGKNFYSEIAKDNDVLNVDKLFNFLSKATLCEASYKMDSPSGFCELGLFSHGSVVDKLLDARIIDSVYRHLSMEA